MQRLQPANSADVNANAATIPLRRWTRCAALAALVLNLAACSNLVISGADRHYQAGRYSDAIGAYERSLSSQTPPRKLFRLAMSYWLAEEPQADTERAVQLLQRLVRSYPQSQYQSLASLLLQFERLAREQTEEINAQKARLSELETSIAQLNDRIGALQTAMGSQREVLVRAESARQKLQSELERRAREVAERDLALEDLRLELEKLKEIDLREPPP